MRFSQLHFQMRWSQGRPQPEPFTTPYSTGTLTEAKHTEEETEFRRNTQNELDALLDGGTEGRLAVAWAVVKLRVITVRCPLEGDNTTGFVWEP